MKSGNSLLFVDHATGLGGAEHSLLFILQNLDREQWQPHLAGREGPLLDRAAALDVPVHPVSLSRLRRSLSFPAGWWRGANELAQLARRIKPAAIYANTVRAALYATPAGWLARRPFVWHMRDFWLSESRPEREWADHWGKRLLTGRATLVITNSAAVKAHLPPSAKVQVVHNGIDLDRFTLTADGPAFRQQVGIPPGVPVVGMAGRMRPWKGQLTFLEMAARIVAARPETHFLLVGGAPFGETDNYPQQVRQLAAALGLEERVTFTGQIEDMPAALAALDVFVHPGAPEPFGLVNVEAMAMQRPVVAFAHGALPEIVLDGETGLLVRPGSVAALAQAVLTLLGDDARRQQMGLAGRRRTETHFTAQRTTTAISALLTQTLYADFPNRHPDNPVNPV